MKIRNISKQDRKDLKVLADDFGLIDRKDVQQIINSCNSYTEGHRAILRIYNQAYM